MATTPNYGFIMPDPTDFVTDLPADFEIFGDEVDSRIKALNPETTEGDLAYRAATANAKARLAIGTAGQVLAVNSGATAPEWITIPGGGQLTEVVFTSSDASYTIPSGVTGIWALCVGSGGGGGATSTATTDNSSGGGGAGQVIEKFFTVSGDTQLNITVPAGGAGATTQGAKGSNGSAATIVGVTTSTTYVSAAGGGGGGGGAAANVAGNSGASGGGNGSSTSASISGAGGGFGAPASVQRFFPYATTSGDSSGGGGATTNGITGFSGGNTNSVRAGWGIVRWDRALAGGGGGSNFGQGTDFGGGAHTNSNVNGNNGTPNTGGGGSGANTSASTKYNGGNGGSGLVVLRFVGQEKMENQIALVNKETNRVENVLIVDSLDSKYIKAWENDETKVIPVTDSTPYVHAFWNGKTFELPTNEYLTEIGLVTEPDPEIEAAAAAKAALLEKLGLTADEVKLLLGQ